MNLKKIDFLPIGALTEHWLSQDALEDLGLRSIKSGRQNASTPFCIVTCQNAFRSRNKAFVFDGVEAESLAVFPNSFASVLFLWGCRLPG